MSILRRTLKLLREQYIKKGGFAPLGHPLKRLSILVQSSAPVSVSHHTQAVQETIDTFGKIDILVNNVGGYGKIVRSSTGRQFVDITEEQWNEFFELNLKTHFLMWWAVVPHF